MNLKGLTNSKGKKTTAHEVRAMQAHFDKKVEEYSKLSLQELKDLKDKMSSTELMAYNKVIAYKEQQLVVTKAIEEAKATFSNMNDETIFSFIGENKLQTLTKVGYTAFCQICKQKAEQLKVKNSSNEPSNLALTDSIGE